MSSFDILNIQFGGAAQLTFNTNDIPENQDVATAVLKIAKKVGDPAIIEKEITALSTPNGVITNDVERVNTAVLTFILDESDTSDLDPVWAYYTYSVKIVTNGGYTNYVVPFGRMYVKQSV
jgi:hypothetical protein